MTPYADVEIAGVALENAEGEKCKCLVVDGANLLTTTGGSTAFAADGTAYTQTLTTSKGRQFGIKADFLPPDVLNNIVEAAMSAIDGGDPFTVTAIDDTHNISESVMPDFAAGWLKYPAQRTHPDVIKDVEFRFITV